MPKNLDNYLADRVGNLDKTQRNGGSKCFSFTMCGADIILWEI
jgi:hypothetical protein